MSEPPLHTYLDLEAYDVVTGESHRALQAEVERLRSQMGIAAIALGRIADGVNEGGWGNLAREDLTHIAREALLRLRETENKR